MFDTKGVSGVLGALLVAASAGTASAEHVPCETGTLAGYSYVCWYGESGNYSQLNTELSSLSEDLENAGLCGPTAAAAALDQLLDRTDAFSTSWIGTSFEPKSRRARITNVASQVGWRDGVGSSNMDWFQGRATDIDIRYTGHLDHAEWVLFFPQFEMFDSYFRDRLENGEAMVLERSKYDESCVIDWFGRPQCTYAYVDGSAHAQAVNGTLTRSDDGLWFTRLWQSHNASGPSATAVADEQIRNFQRLAIHGTDDHRPNGAYTSWFYRSAGVYSIVNRVRGIVTH